MRDRPGPSLALQHYQAGWKTPPYTVTYDGTPYTVFPVHPKSGIAAARRVGLAHFVLDAAGVIVDGRVRYSAVWICAPRWGYTGDAVLLGRADEAGSFCKLCAVKGAPDGPGVYRLFGHDGELLYVGSSDTVRARVHQHRQSARWRDLLADATFESYPSLPSAAAAEIVAIQTERPLHNRLHVIQEPAA